MELSYFLGQLMGLSLIIFAIIGLLRPKLIKAAVVEIESNALVTLFSGFMAIVLGVAVIISHNIWELTWVSVITAFGWAALAKGILYLLAPSFLQALGSVMYTNSLKIRSVLIAALVLGLYLSYRGFGF